MLSLLTDTQARDLVCGADLADIALTGPSAGPHRRTYSKPYAAAFTTQTSISR